ncbi:hypothetical protein [Methanospirillum lacunae]|uniref:PsbP C-terminal domain-containing protein n=1 Tax=Methanospirillum lacunae TaxID=668570 RepID=A0A2V2ND64_9EURY|nr:hypothetical protein [Methanospirillum lacunae]PWR74307.1 hypothetical protein DK846_03945 [Methanospirillum lacunae]
MNRFLILLLLFSIAIPVLAVDTSNWVSQSTDNGYSFKVPPTWQYNEIGTSDNKGVQFTIEESDTSASVIFGYKKEPQNQVLGETELRNFVEEIATSKNITIEQTKSYQNGGIVVAGKDASGFINTIAVENTSGYLKIILFIFSNQKAVSKYSDIIHEINNTLVYPQ